MLLLAAAFLEVHIDQSVQFVDDDVDIVGSHAGGKRRDRFAVQPAGMGQQLPVLYLVIDAVEIFGNGGDPSGIAY